MVGEQAQEMQLAHWLSATLISFLASRIPSWMATWLSIFSTIETLSSQAIALVLVLGSYFLAQRPAQKRKG
jgi:high-affinity iron transporter